MQKFGDLLLNNLSHNVVKNMVSTGFPRWWIIWIDRDTTGAESGTNPFEVLEWVAYGYFMSFEDSGKFTDFILREFVPYNDKRFSIVIEKDIF
jgi:hypothetical protein